MKINYMKLIEKAAENTNFCQFDFGDVYVTLDNSRMLRISVQDLNIHDMDYIEGHFKHSPRLKSVFLDNAHDISLLERGEKGQLCGRTVHRYGNHKVVADKLMRLLPKNPVYSADDMRTPAYICNDDMMPVAMIMPMAYSPKEFERAFPTEECYDGGADS